MSKPLGLGLVMLAWPAEARAADELTWAPAAAGLLWVLGVAGLVAAAGLVVWLERARARAVRELVERTRDLEEAKARAERIARAHEALDRTLQQHAIVAETDAEGRLLLVNDAYCRLSGYSREELLGKNPRLLNSGTHPPEFWQALWRTISSGHHWRAEVCNRAKDGTYYWVDSILAPARGPDGKIERYVEISTDVTDRKITEAELNALNTTLAQRTEMADALAQRAQEASRAKSAFLANMSHEIRTPMNGVLGMTELLLGMGLNPKQEDAARTVYRSAEALLSILNDILDFSKVEAGRFDFEQLPFDVEQLVLDVVALFRGRVTDGRVELLARVRPGVPARVQGDPARLRQILTNLVGNAIKFTDAGHVLLEVEPLPGKLRFKVRDTGLGIPKDRQQAVFEPFTQADASTSRRFGGTGLGLAICRSLAEGMGGSIALESQVGEGSTFSVELPLAPVGLASPPERPLEGQRIGVVCPRALSRGVLVEQLETLGAEPIAAASLAELQSPGPLAALLCDEAALSPDAAATLAEARLRLGPGVPVVLASSAQTVPEPTALERLGVRGLVRRPCRTWSLAEALGAAHATRTPVPAPAPASPPPPTPGRRRRVLLAEDNTINQRIAAAMLARLGCDVTVTSDGREAVAAFRPAQYDLVLMDCQMPEIDGYEATAAIRALERNTGAAPTPIIAMTANVTLEDRERCRLAGMDEHLAKPTRFEQLAAALARWSPHAEAPPVEALGPAS